MAPRLTIKEILDLVEMRRLVATGEARARRQRAGLSLAEVAATIGVTPAAISRWENDHRRPTRHASALAYADLLKRLGTDDE
jgi:transcriptional regulator with XRE-family HTH domain